MLDSHVIGRSPGRQGPRCTNGVVQMFCVCCGVACSSVGPLLCRLGLHYSVVYSTRPTCQMSYFTWNHSRTIRSIGLP